MMPSRTQAERILLWTMPWVAVFTLISGSVFWARRVGWLQPEIYWFAHIRWLAWFNQQSDSAAASLRVAEFNNSLHALSGAWTLTKWPKQLILILIAAIVLSQWRQWRVQRPMSWIGIGLLVLGAGSALGALWTGRWMALLAGSRSFISWFVAVFGSTVATPTVLRAMARVLAALLVVQGVLVAIELQEGVLVYSIHMFDRDVVRVVGSFNLPLSLGSFAVIAWMAAFCWGELRASTLTLLGLVLIFVLVPSGSAVAWVALLCALAVMALTHMTRPWRIGILLLALPVMLAIWQLLPTLTGRHEVHDSLWGRIYPIQQYAEANLSTRETLFGLGFGEGTNALGAHQNKSTSELGRPMDHAFGDSLPASLFWQVGLTGLILSYAWMGMALHGDARSRPIGVAIVVSSLAVNVTELFPVNLVLGFWLAHASRVRDHDDATA